MPKTEAFIDAGRWHNEGSCTCGGWLTNKYTYKDDRSIRLRIRPGRNRFNLYSRNWQEWDKPLADLEAILRVHGLL